MNARAWFYGTSFHGNVRSGASVSPSDIARDRFHVRTIANGQALTCKCARVLYFEDKGTEYRAVCPCGNVVRERKAQ